jgi:phosphatidylinositol-4,5-bisphosphate 3-kinase
MEEDDNQNALEYLYTEKKADTSIAVGDKSSFVNVKIEDVDSIEKDAKVQLKERLCCIELINNNRIYLKYELRWKIKDLIENIVKHPEFKKLYSTRDWIFNSENHLALFDVHLALYRKIKDDSETKIDFTVNFNNLHNKGLLKNPKYPFFIFKDNRNNGELIQFYEDKVEYLKKIKDYKNESYLIYKNYLPRVNPLNILNWHPEFENFFHLSKYAIKDLSGYNINHLIYEKKQVIDTKKKTKKSKAKDKNNNTKKENTGNDEEDDEVQKTQGDLDWLVYDDESMNFLTTLDNEDFKLNSNIKFLNQKDKGTKVLFEDVLENTKLEEEEMKEMFIDLSYPTGEEGVDKEITKRFKLDLKTTGYELCESMRKKLEPIIKNLNFDTSKKILKVKSLNDYVLHLKYPLSQFSYINECVMRNRIPEYIIMDNPLMENDSDHDVDQSKARETISITMGKNSSSKKDIDKFVGVSASLSKGNNNINMMKGKKQVKNENQKDELALFIDSIEESIQKYNLDEISATQKTIEKKEKEFLEMSSIVEDTFIKQEESIFDDDDVLLHIQNKIGARASNVNANQSILALNNLNLSTINSNARPSGIINPNFLRQSIAKQGIVHSIYDEDTIINIINESMNQDVNKYKQQNRKGGQGPVSMMTKSRKKESETPNIFENSVKENVQIYPLLIEKSLPLNIREIKMPFSILVNYAELDEVFDSYPRDSDKSIEVLIFKFQINIGEEPFCDPVSIKWTNKRNKKNKLPSNPLFNKRIYFDIDYSTLPTFATLLIKVKHLVFGEGSRLVTSNTVRWVNFKLFDHNRNLMTGQHKLNLYSKEFSDFSYFVFVDNITEEDPSKIYFEIDTFAAYVHNSNFKDDNVEINVNNLMMSKKDKEEIEKIKKKTPFDSLNNYDKKILWANRYKLTKIPELLPKLLLCVDYKNPQHIKELKKVLRMAKLLTPVQSMELLTGKYLHEYIRSFAVNCLQHSSINEIETYLIQLVQGLKFEMYHDNKLATFLLKLSVQYPLTIGHCFFWALRSEMHNVNVQQRFGLYLQVFLSKIGPKLITIYEQECDFIRRMNVIAEKVKDKKTTNKKTIQKNFVDDLTAYNNEIVSKKLEISMPLNFKLRIKGINIEKCRIMKSKKKPLWLELKNADDKGNDIIVLFKAGDDLRMDIVTLQLFKIMQTLWYKNHLNLKMSLYNVISTGDMEGMLEVVTNSATVAQIHKEQGGSLQSFKRNSLKDWIGKKSNVSIEECHNNFLLTNVAYCCATFVLGIGDRHSDNIMLKKNGELFHIDFGHFLGHFKYKMGIKRERAPFVFTNQFKNVLDSKYDDFKKKLWEAYKILRDHSDVLVTLLRILICTDIPELKEKDIEYLNQSLVLNYNTKEAEKFLDDKLKESVDSWSVPLNFWIHYMANK